MAENQNGRESSGRQVNQLIPAWQPCGKSLGIIYNTTTPEPG
jgi:hypothetical protein